MILYLYNNNENNLMITKITLEITFYAKQLKACL